VTTRRAPSALLVEGQDRVDRLLAGLVDERARVDHDQVGARVGLHAASSVPVGVHAVGEEVPISLSESTWFFGQPSVST
jgi:hypothetical protein